MSTKKITEFGLLLTVSLVLSYLESLIPVMVAVPGVKMGLANIVTMVVLYRYDGKNAFFFMTLRVVLAGVLFSGITGIAYSFAGGLFCIVVMGILMKFPFFSILGISMAGAVSHNFGQIVVACFVMENAHILYYFPALCISGLITGLVVGYVSSLLIQQIQKNGF
ncbi:MAG: Gx transporter family protein [Lachnospiraceae bacterium]